jgi:uncharacterized Zn-binding protein involved in type VI secretion
MSFKAHRQDDLRVCGAKTVVVGQSTVTINGKLWAVLDDPNDHGSGNLENTTGSSVTITGKPIIVHGPDLAKPDDLLHTPDETKTADGAASVFCY